MLLNLLNLSPARSYIKLCIEKTVQNNTYGYTVCPSCGNGQYHLGGGIARPVLLFVSLFSKIIDKSPIVLCELCEKEYCFSDKVFWSADHDCVDYSSVSGKLPENVKACPTCGGRVSFVPSFLHPCYIRYSFAMS